MYLSEKLLNEFLEEKHKEEEKKIKKFDSEINLTEILKNNKRYMNIGRNKNYKIIKTKDEVKSQSVEEDEEESGEDLYTVKLKRFKKNKRIIKAYENMKIINDTYKSSLGLECPRFVRNFERYDNREFYKGKEVTFASIVEANKNFVFDPEKRQLKESLESKDNFQISSSEFQTSTRNSSPLTSFIKKKIILPRIF